MRIAKEQAGVLTRGQALAAGVTDNVIAAHLSSGRWRRILWGVYATFRGPLPREAVLWAIVLRSGPTAVLSHHTAAELTGLAVATDPVHVTVAGERSPDPIPGVRIHRSARAVAAAHPTRTPPQTRVEETLVDLTQIAADVDDAIAWLARGVGARLTTVERLVEALALRKKLRWRPQLRAGLRDIALGCHSALELTYLREVERAHRLPPATRQARHHSDGRTRYHDVRYRHRTVVELDGRAGHDEPFRDMRRDNLTVADGDLVLRYGYRDVTEEPCRVAAQVIGVLRLGGWRGTPRGCGRPRCVVPKGPAIMGSGGS